MRTSLILAASLALATPALTWANDIGQVKVAKGAVQIEREGKRMPAAVGTPVHTADVIVTGPDGSAGVTFSDNSLVSVGPNSEFAIDKYRFDSTTHVGEFQGSLRKGKLAAVSGKMVKQTPESMKIRTPSSVMAVRGTEFVVEVKDPATATAAR
jgi:hypothetical protein